MTKKNQDHPLWYKIWQLVVAISAVYILIKVFTADGLTTFGYSLVVFTHVSLLLDMYFFRIRNKFATKKKDVAFTVNKTE